MKRQIPNIITLLNLLFGSLAVVSLLTGQYYAAFGWTLAALSADFLDGLAARHFGSDSDLGRELDSLADLISFGLFPGLILYTLLTYAWGKEPAGIQGVFLPAVPAFVLTAASCLRLAKFNLIEEPSKEFRGLPTPACTVFLTGLLLIFQYNSFSLQPFLSNPWVLYAITGLFSYLLLSNIRMFSLKMSVFRWKGNEMRFVFVFLSILLILLFKETALSMIVVLYVLVSIVFIKKLKVEG